MQVLVIGAGAVGSYYGGRLALAGHDVTLVGHPRHMAAIRSTGLTINSKITGSHTFRIKASDNVAKPAAAADLVLITTKSYDTEAAALSVREIAGPGTTVLSLQNGIDNHEIANRMLGSGRVFPTVIYVGVRIPEPGVVEHVSRGEIILPRDLEALVQVFNQAGIPASTSDNILSMVWGKLLLNASCNALGMISGASFGELAANPAAKEVICGAVQEVWRVASANGVRIPVENPVEQVLKTAAGLGAGVSSMLQDFRAGKRIEIEALNGIVVRMGKTSGIPTPYNGTLYAIAKLLEEKTTVSS